MQEHRLLVPMRNKIDLCYELSMRDLFPLAEKQLAALDEALKQSQTTDNYYYDWRIWYDRLADWIHFKLAQPSLRAPILQEKADNLFRFFWKYTFSLYGVILNVQGTYDSYTYDTSQIESILPLFEPAQHTNNPMLLCEYYTVMFMRPQANQADFEAAYDFIQKHKDNIDKHSLARIYTMLANFLRKQTPPEKNNTSLLLTLHLDSIANLIAEKQPISAYAYNTITYIAYSLKGAAWVRQFIAEYSPHLPQQLREGWQTFVEARLLLFEGKPTETIALLNAYADFYEQDYFYTKLVLLFAYYETNNLNAFELLLDTTDHTLRNRKTELPDREYLQFKNTLRLLQKLHRLSLQPDPAAFKKLQQWFEATPDFYLKSWLEGRVKPETKQKSQVALDYAY